MQPPMPQERTGDHRHRANTLIILDTTRPDVVLLWVGWVVSEIREVDLGKELMHVKTARYPPEPLG
jgi:hypothetical protein